MNESDTGLLLNRDDILLQRVFFQNMLELRGIKVGYYVPRKDKHYSGASELETNYKERISIKCIFEEHPTQKTMRKLGWNSEQTEAKPIIQIPYDTPEIQFGCLIEVPAGIDNAPPRLFKVTRISNIAVYPANLICELSPVILSSIPSSQVTDFTKSDFTLVREASDDDDD